METNLSKLQNKLQRSFNITKPSEQQKLVDILKDFYDEVNPVPSLDNLYKELIFKTPEEILNYHTCGECWIEESGIEGGAWAELGCEDCENDATIFPYFEYVKLQNGVETDNEQPNIDLSDLSETKLKLLKECLNGIRSIDDDKIKSIDEKYYSEDYWMEETCTPSHPTIKIFRSGIGNSVMYNDISVLDTSIDF